MRSAGGEQYFTSLLPLSPFVLTNTGGFDLSFRKVSGCENDDAVCNDNPDNGGGEADM
jgi:hypothetical protein